MESKADKSVEAALRFCLKAHAGQKRKTDESEYVIHPIYVALSLAEEGFSKTIIAAALLHDVVEDAGVSIVAIKKEFGGEVAEIVEAVSEDKTLEWEARKSVYLEKVKAGPLGARAVSLADKIHNAESLIEAHKKMGPSVWNKFNRGKDKKIWFERECFTMFTNAGDLPEKLLARYGECIEQIASLTE